MTILILIRDEAILKIDLLKSEFFNKYNNFKYIKRCFLIDLINNIKY